MKNRVLGILLLLGVLGITATANASDPLEHIGPTTTSGNGLGAVLTTVTVQNSPSEQGCVGWSGTADVVGSAACPSPLVGGDEKTGASQTLTHTIGELITSGVTDATDIAAIFNGSENDNIITLNDMRITIFDAGGTIQYQSAAEPAPVTYGPVPTFGGTGGAGQLYRLTSADATFVNGLGTFDGTHNTWRVGMAGYATGSSGGNETFSLSRRCPIITLTPATLPAATQFVPYSVSGSASGGTLPYTSIIASPAGPYFGGIVFSSDVTTGAFSFIGTPTTTGTVDITVTATDAQFCTGTITYTLVVAAGCTPITLSPTTIPSGTSGVAYAGATLTVSGGTAPYTITDTPSGAIDGISFTDNGDGTATLGTEVPTAAGSFPFTVNVTDTNGCPGSQAYVLVINQALCPTITVSPATIPSGTAGVAYPAQVFTASGGTGPYTFVLTGTLPTGMSFSVDTLSGTPTQTGSFPITVTATDTAGNPVGCQGARAFTLVINCAAVSISPTTVPAGVLNTAYGPVTFTQTGGTGTITFSESGTLPTGITFTDNGDGTATLSGTPTQSGTFPFSITVTDQNGCNHTTFYSLVVPAPIPQVQIPTLGGFGFALLALGLAGAAFILIKRG